MKPQDFRTVNSRWLMGTMLACLVSLMLISLAFVVVGSSGNGNPPPGTVLAVFKFLSLVFVFRRVRAGNVYSMQWSSMFILLFIAEGTVRAASDPQPAAALGVVQTIVAAIYFFAVLALLRPFKKRAEAARDPK